MEVKIGDHVLWHDEFGRPHNALVTAVWGPAGNKPSINVVVLNPDENQTDTYGRKIQRETSVVYADQQYAHGRYWRFPE